jgi:hypothetical protein
MNQALKDILFVSFLQELAENGNTWRLARPSTFADMMLMHRKKTDSYSESDLLSIVNWGLRYDLSKDMLISVSELTIEGTKAKLDDDDAVMAAYLPLMDKMFSQMNEQNSADFYELTRELDYLAVLDQLDLAADFELLISRVAKVALSLLIDNFHQPAVPVRQ